MRAVIVDKNELVPKLFSEWFNLHDIADDLVEQVNTGDNNLIRVKLAAYVSQAAEDVDVLEVANDPGQAIFQDGLEAATFEFLLSVMSNPMYCSLLTVADELIFVFLNRETFMINVVIHDANWSENGNQ